MPFDGDPKKYETKPDVFSLEGLIGWLETQNPRERYCYINSGACLLHRYFTARGVPVRTIIPSGYEVGDAEWHPYPAVLNEVAVGYPETYRGALARARRLLSSQSR